jgi:hypothetical protein
VSGTFNGTVPAGNNGELRFAWPVLMKQGISYKIKLIYDEDMVKLPLASVYHMENTSYSWNEADPKEKVTAFFTLAKPVKPIVDICGLILAKKTV